MNLKHTTAVVGLLVDQQEVWCGRWGGRWVGGVGGVGGVGCQMEWGQGIGAGSIFGA